jgi:hypothetical protein
MKPTITPSGLQLTRITAAAAALAAAVSAHDAGRGPLTTLESTLASLETQRQTYAARVGQGDTIARPLLEGVLVQKTRTAASLESATAALLPLTNTLHAAVVAAEDLINELFGNDFKGQLGDRVQAAMSPFMTLTANARGLVNQTDEMRALNRFLNGAIHNAIAETLAAAAIYGAALAALGSDGEVWVFPGATPYVPPA